MATWRSDSSFKPESERQVQLDIRDLLLVIAADLTAQDQLDRTSARELFVRLLKARRDQ